MNLFGLEGSGFLIAVCLTLMLSGMIVFYVRQNLMKQIIRYNICWVLFNN